MLRSILLASVAAAGVVTAQSSDVCGAKSTTAKTQSDLDALASCSTLSGDLILSGGAWVQAMLNGVKSIKGNLVIAGETGLQSFQAPLVNSIGAGLNLTGLTTLGTFSMPSLSSVGSIYMQTLPALQSLTFTATVTEADSVLITDTYLQSLDGINLVTVSSFNINNNKYLKDVTVQLTNVTNALSIEFNAAQVAASFPNLTWANNATFRSCGSVSLPNLQVVNGSLGFFENSFTELMAPKLTAVGTGTQGGDITFANNDELTNVSMPVLTTIIGTLQFVNDTEITQIEGFPDLSSVHGSIDISGNFSQADFPAIKDIRGGFNCQSSAPFDCTNFNKLQNGVVKGSYECTGQATNPGVEGTTPSTTGSNPSSTSSSSKNAAGRISAATNSFAAIAAVTFFAALFL